MGTHSFIYGRPRRTSHPPCMSKPAFCLLLVPEPHNLQIHHLHLFLPPLFSFLYSIFFINIHSPVVFVIQHSWANAFCLSNKPYSSVSDDWLLRQIAACCFSASFGHLCFYRPVVKTKGMTKVFIYSIPFLFPADMLLSLYPFTFSKLCLNPHFNFLLSLPFFHVSLIAVLFEKGSCLCLQSAFQSVVPVCLQYLNPIT